MERKVLVSEIVSFINQYHLIRNTENLSMAKGRIEEELNKSEFVEGLIHVLNVRTKRRKGIDTEKLITILIELEKIRLELEYKK